MRENKEVRTTLILPVVLDQNLIIYCAQNRLTKGKVICEAIKEFLTGKGLQPDKEPASITVHYD